MGFQSACFSDKRRYEQMIGKPENIGAPLVGLVMTEDFADHLIDSLEGLKKTIA